MPFFVHMVGRSPQAVSATGFTSPKGERFAALERDERIPAPPLGASFEEAYEAFERLPRMFVEPDGSFVWVGETPSHWQLDGVLYDHAGRLRYVELKGDCPAEALDLLLRACGWPATPVAFDLVESGVRLPEEEFRRFAGLIT